MSKQEIIARCMTKLGMSKEAAEWVAENLYTYAVPDFSEWSWAEIDRCFRDVLFFMGKTDVEITEALCAS